MTKFLLERLWNTLSAAAGGELDINSVANTPLAQKTTTGDPLTYLDIFDKNGDGKITKEEFINEALRNCVEYLNKNTPVNLLDILDTNNDGIVSKAEVGPILQGPTADSARAEQFFSILDNNGNDTIEGEELIDFMSSMMREAQFVRAIIPEGTEPYIPSAAGDDGVIKNIQENESWRTARELERID